MAPVVLFVLDMLNRHHTVILQSDHGGHGRNHGSDTPEDMTIPWIASGLGIRHNHTITAPVSLLDTAPTIARLLDIPLPASWEGRHVEEIFA